jgi:hypothetical protein
LEFLPKAGSLSFIFDSKALLLYLNSRIHKGFYFFFLKFVWNNDWEKPHIIEFKMHCMIQKFICKIRCKMSIQNCGNSFHYDGVMNFWKGNLMTNFLGKDEEPHPKLWYEAYSRLIDVSDGGSLAYACRHIGFESFVYKSTGEIVNHDPVAYERYYLRVKLPGGTGIGSFKDVFSDKVVRNVVIAWKKLYDGLTSYTEVASYVRDCHLDTVG